MKEYACKDVYMQFIIRAVVLYVDDVNVCQGYTEGTVMSEINLLRYPFNMCCRPKCTVYGPGLDK